MCFLLVPKCRNYRVDPIPYHLVRSAVVVLLPLGNRAAGGYQSIAVTPVSAVAVASPDDDGVAPGTVAGRTPPVGGKSRAPRPAELSNGLQ